MSRLRQRLGLALLAAGALPAAAAAQTSALVALPAADPPALAARLTALGFDVLPDRAPGGALQLIVTPEELAALAALGLPAEVLARGRPFAEIQAGQAEGGGPPGGYPTGPQIEAQLAALAAAYPERCVLVDLTDAYGVAPTFEGRHLLALRISDHAALEEDEPAVLVVATHHARELAPPVIALDAAQRLLADYGSDPAVTAAVDGHEIWIAPLWNPDGYAYVFGADNLWRKNRRPVSGAVGVDLNRNYPFGWSAGCAGSTVESSETYKGPSPASEAETQTMLAWSTDRHWAKVLDLHSYGQEALWGYACLGHPLDSFLEDEAQALSVAAGYGGAVRNPTGEGEEQEWQLATRGAHAFLLEVGSSFQPPYTEALAEAAQVWPGLQWLLARPIPVSGHVTDGCTHLPLEASIKIAGLSFGNGEAFGSGGPFGRYALFVPAGGWTLTISAAGYASSVHVVNVPPGGAKTLDVALMPLVPGGCIADVGGGKPGAAGVPVLAAQGTLAPGSPGTLTLAAAAPSALALLVVGLTQLDAPFKGGTLVPWPHFLAGLDTGPAGAVTLPFTWPAGVPAGVEAWLQAWVSDAAATHGLAASNGLHLTAG